MTQTIHRESLFPRIDGIRKNLQKLTELSKLDFETFKSGDVYDLAQHHLRLALEGVFHISSHILSRLPGGRAIEYRELALKMGETGVVPKEFAKNKMIHMAGLRNILVHAYADLDARRFFIIVQNFIPNTKIGWSNAIFVYKYSVFKLNAFRFF